MHVLPTAWSALCAVVVLLGLKHGFDADHLAAIDGLTRLSSHRRRPWAKACGALFSLGHGVVVLAVAGGLGLLSERWAPPAWLDLFGAWVSIGFLALVGGVNLCSLLRAAPGGMVPLVGIKGPWLARLLPARSPLGVAAVGALFALSFDTVSQAALFAVTAAQFGGAVHGLALGSLFVLGMLLADGLNGWWISRLLARADEIAVLTSRVMSAAVSALSLLVAGLGLVRLLSPGFGAWAAGKELFFGAAAAALVALSYVLARSWARASGRTMPLAQSR